MEEPEPWTCTVARLSGLHLMRPERSWRPIVTIELDNVQQHETVLGSDGQNVNLKASFRLRGASFASQVEVKVFHRSQSKKKGKKRSLVGSTSCSLGDMWKKDGKEPKLELRLQCQKANNRSVASRGRPQNGAILHLRLNAPSHVTSPPTSTLVEDEEGYLSASSSSSESSLDDTQTLVPPPTEPVTLRRRRRHRGFCVNSDEEPEFHSESEDDDDTKPLLNDTLFDDDFDDDPDDEQARPTKPISIWLNPIQWIAASSLPQYTERIEVPPNPSFNRFERAISSFTIYAEMKSARYDSEFEKIFTRLQHEWTYTAGLLVALAAVDTAVFSVSPGSLFQISPLAASAVAASSIASGLGIASASWLLVRYAWVDLGTFIGRAADVLSEEGRPSYLFFALSARVPSLLTLVSALALLLFLGVVAWSAWPTAVIVGCFLVGVLMGLQWLVFCVLCVVKGIRRGFMFCAGPFVRRESAGARDAEMREPENHGMDAVNWDEKR